MLCFVCDTSTNPNKKDAEWILQRNEQDDITYYAIFFIDKNTGWITGSGGTIEKTNDGGETWQKQQTGVTASLWEISFLDEIHGWACGSESTILKTENGGDLWESVSPEKSDNTGFFAIQFANLSEGWTSSNQGEILHTTDGGLFWQVQQSGYVGACRLSVIDAQTAFALTQDLLVTENSGSDWALIDVPIPKYYVASQMSFIDKQHGWITTENGTGGMYITEFPVMITTDGGETWHTSDSLEDLGFRCLFFVNANTGWVAGFQNIYKTNDGGKNWSPDYSSDHESLSAKDMHFIDETTGWLINFSGAIYKYQKTPETHRSRFLG